MFKRGLYIICFIILGILASFLVHTGIEIPIINLLVSNFNKYSLGLSWGQWQMIHDIGAVVLLVLGMWVGYRQGVYWWNVIYVEKRLRR